MRTKEQPFVTPERLEAAKFILNSRPLRKKVLEEKFGYAGIAVLQHMMEEHAVTLIQGLYAKNNFRIRSIISKYELELARKGGVL